MRREKNWQPDIYDLGAERATRLAAEGSVSAVDYDDIEEEDDDLVIEPVAIEALASSKKKGATPVTVTVRAVPQKSNDFVVLGGMVAGAVVGALVGLFVAPDNGEATRKKLAQQAQQQLETGKSRVGEMADSATTKVTSAVGATKPTNDVAKTGEAIAAEAEPHSPAVSAE